MEKRRISLTDILVGAPLLWDVYDATSTLLLRKGHVIERTQQIEALMQRGLFVLALTGGQEKQDSRRSQPESPSAVRLINLANKHLARLLRGLDAEPQAEKKTLEIVGIVESAIKVNADIALASILMNQGAASYATRHCIDTAILASIVARALEKTPDQQRMIMAAALTMNIGMLDQQDHFQNKEESLSAGEQRVIHSHADESVRLLRKAGILDPDWLASVAAHHENEDGSGYPGKGSAAEISDNAKILALADRYCARIIERSYRKPILPNAALREMLTIDRNSLNGGLVKCFIHEIGIFPIGTFVRLANGEIGIVTSKGDNNLAPIVNALVGPRGVPLAIPIRRETVRSIYSIRDVLSKEQAAIRVSMQQLWGHEAAL